MITLILLGVLTAVALAAVIYYSKAKLIVKLAVLPLALALGVTGYNIFQDELGRPIYDRPEGDFTYMTHLLIGNSALLVADDGISPRIYIFDPTDEEEAELEKAKKKTEEGRSQQGNFEKGTNAESPSDGTLEFWTRGENPK